MAWAAAWVIASPCAAAAAAFCLPGRARALAIAAGVLLALAHAAALAFAVAEDGARDLALGGWEAPLGIRLRVDGLSAFFVAVQAVVGAVVSVYAWGYFSSREDAAWFWMLWLLLWAALNGLYLTGDAFNAYVTLELVGVTAVGLVAMAGGAALAAGVRYLLVTLFGSLLYLAGVALLYAEVGALDLEVLAPRAAGSPAARAALPLMATGLLLKTAAFPLHVWLPPAHANAAAPASAILSGLVIKGSFYLLARLWLDLFPADATSALAELLGALGVAGVLWGSAQALRQRRVKMLVAYSTIAQVGYLLMAFPLGGAAWLGAVYFAGAHACAKASMFLAAGSLARDLGRDDLGALRGAAEVLPVTLFSFALAGVALIGVPPTGGFLGKWFLLTEAARQGHALYIAAIPIGTLLSAAYVFRVVGPAVRVVRRDPVPRGASMRLDAPPLVLALAAVALGFALAPIAEFLDHGAPLPRPPGEGYDVE